MFFWWLVGVLAVVTAVVIAILAATAGGPLLGGIIAIVMAILLLLAYIRAYLIAWHSIPVSALVDSDATPPLTSNPLLPFGDVPNYVGGTGERHPRAFMIGLNAATNAGLALGFMQVDPTLGIAITLWDFVVVSLAAAPPVSANRVFQGVLGWTAWISPTSLVASAVGLFVFVLNLPFAVASAIASGAGVWWPVRLDWASGAIETAGGGLVNLVTASGFGGGTVGHFSFITAAWGTDPTDVQETFTPTAPSPLNKSAHEVGHCLDYVAFGGIRNLIALFDQLVFSNRTSAYTELTADSHVPSIGRFQVNMWSG